MKRSFLLLMLFGAFLALTAEDCLLENTDVEIPLRDDVILEFTSQGAVDADIDTVNFGQTLQDVEDDSDSSIDTLVAITVEGVYWRLAEDGNRGSPDTEVNGTITVRRQSTGESEVAVTFSNLAIETVPDFVRPDNLREEAIDLLLAGFDEYVAARNAGLPIPNLIYEFEWSTSGAPEPVDFDWEVKVDFTIVGKFSIEVPDLLD
jgi:hypothetical protein